jgi:hypothetical protein
MAKVEIQPGTNVKALVPVGRLIPATVVRREGDCYVVRATYDGAEHTVAESYVSRVNTDGDLID